jgi:hypothetical protein
MLRERRERREKRLGPVSPAGAAFADGIGTSAVEEIAGAKETLSNDRNMLKPPSEHIDTLCQSKRCAKRGGQQLDIEIAENTEIF